MSVLQTKPSGAAHYPAQGRPVRTGSASGRFREVVTDTSGRKSGRRALPVIILAAAMILFLCILLSDLSCVYAVSTQTSLLSSAIHSLESSNSLLRSELSVALNHPVLRSQADALAPEIVQTILLTAGPAQ